VVEGVAVDGGEIFHGGRFGVHICFEVFGTEQRVRVVG
jgi:hypothetical protein